MRLAAWSVPRVSAVWRRYGWRTALAFVCKEPWLVLRLALLRTAGEATFELPMPGTAPVRCRPESSDLEAFWQVLVSGQFDFLKASSRPLRALDCGANIGTATLAILERCPAAVVVAIEPDPGNFAQLEANTRHLGPRVICLRAAVWSESGDLVFDERPYRDGRQWSTRVRAAQSGESGAILARDLPAIMSEVGWEGVDLVKIDIEGAETEVFRTADRWLSFVDCIAVELHDADAVSAFERAVGTQFSIQHCGELTVGTRLSDATNRV